jgi:hypothetical protein
MERLPCRISNCVANGVTLLLQANPHLKLLKIQHNQLKDLIQLPKQVSRGLKGVSNASGASELLSWDGVLGGFEIGAVREMKFQGARGLTGLIRRPASRGRRSRLGRGQAPSATSRVVGFLLRTHNKMSC